MNRQQRRGAKAIASKDQDVIGSTMDHIRPGSEKAISERADAGDARSMQLIEALKNVLSTIAVASAPSADRPSPSYPIWAAVRFPDYKAQRQTAASRLLQSASRSVVTVRQKKGKSP